MVFCPRKEKMSIVVLVQTKRRNVAVFAGIGLQARTRLLAGIVGGLDEKESRANGEEGMLVCCRVCRIVGGVWGQTKYWES